MLSQKQSVPIRTVYTDIYYRFIAQSPNSDCAEDLVILDTVY